MLKFGNTKCSEPARSPVTVPPPVFHESHGMPVAPPPEDLSNYAAPTNGSRPEGTPILLESLFKIFSTLLMGWQ